MRIRHWAILAGAAALASGCAQIQTSDVTGVTGGALGGVFGGLLGSQFGSGTGQLAFTAVGSSLGALFGGAVGRSVGDGLSGSFAGQGAYQDPYQTSYQAPPAGPPTGGGDQTYISEAQALAANMPLGEAIAWDNPGTGNFGTVTAIRDGTSNEGLYCRQFENAGRAGISYSVACQSYDGSWRAVQ